LSLIRSAWQACFGEDITQKRRTGPDQFRAFCPSHSERNPSCDVSIAKDAWICRACGASGGYLALVIAAGYATTKGEAASWLERHGVRL